MIALNEKSTVILQQLISMIDQDSEHIELDGSSIPETSITLENMGDMEPGFTITWALTHYNKVNGDMPANPQIRIGELDGKFYPLSYRNDFLEDYQEVMPDPFSHDQHINELLQQEIAEFVNEWLDKILVQQGLRS